MRNAEAKIQAAVVQWIRTVAPQVLVFAIPNGGLRTKSEAALMRFTGVLAGIPDLAIVLPGGKVAFFEVKTPEGRLSQAQADMLERLDDMGVPYGIVRSVDDARDEFRRWYVVTREVAEAAA